MTEETLTFQAEVARLLNIVVHSLYSEKEIFLRELISNASDACDRLRYAALTEPGLLGTEPELKIRLLLDKGARTLTIADNGIGMNRAELIENLGTIARSGTAAFLEQLSGDAAKDLPLIGQFGVGFYSAFMVAARVEVFSRKAGETGGWHWTSEGSGDFTIGEAPEVGRGTRVVLHLRPGEDEFLDRARIEQIVKTYSDHIGLPILLGESANAVETTINSGAALWTRPRAAVTAEQYREFYHHVAHALDEPWAHIHYKAEGKLDYAVLVFVPGRPPFDLFDPSRKNRVRLYVRRVFITEDCEGLIAPYLRFLRGIVDSEDLPLNVSREMLQNNPTLARMRQAITRRVLGELEKEAKDKARYAEFWKNFGAVLKEGLYEDHENRERLLKLARFRSTFGPDLYALDEYLERRREGQKAIYLISGEDAAQLQESPQIEGFRARGIEVLLLTDPVDDFWTQMVPDYQDVPFKSVTRAGADLSAIPLLAEEAKAEGGAETATDEAAAPSESRLGTLVALIKQTLGEAVKDVRLSDRLTRSAVCLVADEHGLDLHLERMLKQHRAAGGEVKSVRVLEINPRHRLIRRLAQEAGTEGSVDRLKDPIHLLLDQARIIEGEALPDPAAFARRLSAALAKGLG